MRVEPTARLIWTFALATAGEVAGLMWWMTALDRGQLVSAFVGLAVGKGLESCIFAYLLMQAPSKGGGRKNSFIVSMLVLIALFEIVIWSIWHSTFTSFGPIAAAAILFLLMHVKHDADVAIVSDTLLGRTWLSPKALAASGLETLGAVLAIGCVQADKWMLATSVLFVCVFVEHVLDSLVTGAAMAGRDFRTPNPDRFRGKQNSMTVVSKIKPDEVDRLRELLRTIGNDVESMPQFPLTKLKRIHFCCWFIADAQAPVLIFEVNFDGPEGEFLEELIETVQPGLANIYSYCQGLPTHPTNEEVRLHLTGQRVFTNTFYIGLHGIDAERIRREESLRVEIESFIDAKQRDSTFQEQSSSYEIRRAIQEHIESDSRFEWTKDGFIVPWNVKHGEKVAKLIRNVTIGICGLLLVALLFVLCAWILQIEVHSWAVGMALGAMALILVALVYLVRLRWKETHDVEPDWNNLDWPEVDVFNRENQQSINHLANLAPLKTGWTRSITTRGILVIVHWASRLIYNRGVLAGTSTIHFARWAVINQGKDLLFLSNYDGSWERYLSDFVDRSSKGLTAIWSNTVEFPRSRWLVFGGAANEENFKAAARRRQVASLLWYSAYPKLTLKNIENNRAICADLFTELDDNATIAWLFRL